MNSSLARAIKAMPEMTVRNRLRVKMAIKKTGIDIQNAGFRLKDKLKLPSGANRAGANKAAKTATGIYESHLSTTAGRGHLVKSSKGSTLGIKVTNDIKKINSTISGKLIFLQLC